MSQLDNELLSYASDKFGTKEESGSAGIATEETNGTQTGVQDSAGIAADNTVAETTNTNTQEPEQNNNPEPATETPVVDYWKHFEEKTNGIVKDEETLKGVLEKFNGYESLSKQKEDLEKNQWKPANEYIKALDEITRNGASKDQIKAFVKLNEYGDINDLSPLDAKVAKMVLVDGYSEDIARKMVNKEFDTSDFEDGDDEKAIIEEKLRVSAQGDIKALEAYRKQLETVENTESKEAEAKRLQEIANTELYNKAVLAEAPKIAQHFPSKLNYEFQIGEDKVSFEDSIDKDFISKEVPKLIENYFMDTREPVTQESINDAFKYVMAEHLMRNDQERLKSAYSKGLAAGLEKASSKYENRSGLPNENSSANPSAPDPMKQFYKDVLSRV